MKVLPPSFSARPALQVARALLGCVLVRRLTDGTERRGLIVETEAYLGPHDLACHTSKGRTPRTEVMFGPPGHAYVYLVYGMHFCLNVVTGRGAAVLLRGLEPVDWTAPKLDGPGKLTRALAIDLSLNRLPLNAPPLWLEAGPSHRRRVRRSPRIGVGYAGEWAAKNYRFELLPRP